MPPAPRPEGPAGLALIVHDGAFERVHYALVLASAAAATDRKAILFFTGRAVHALRPEGWRLLGGDPAGRAASFAARGVADFGELMDACRDLGVRIIACEMGLRAEGLSPEDLRPDLAVEVAGVVTFLQAAGGTVLFI
jgi:peroxiredoxin family protein